MLAVKKALSNFAGSKRTIDFLLEWYYGKNAELKDFELGLET